MSTRKLSRSCYGFLQLLFIASCHDHVAPVNEEGTVEMCGCSLTLIYHQEPGLVTSLTCMCLTSRPVHAAVLLLQVLFPPDCGGPGLLPPLPHRTQGLEAGKLPAQHG
jgi:hypothetical protein